MPLTKNSSPRTKVLFFWDYDTQWGADRSRMGGGPKTWGPLEFEHTETLLELHAEYDVPACFAVVGAAALPGQRPYHAPEQIRQIHAAGHEVASHSHRHEWLPALDRGELRETLRLSKDSLEQCIGAPVTSFVPPWNQPFDFPARLAFSLSERREAGSDRTDLMRLCRMLAETGYKFCRVAYRPLPQRFKDQVFGRKDGPGRTESIARVTCLRLNGFGFARSTGELLDRCVRMGGFAVIYAHPHSLKSGDSQDQKYLVPFLQSVSRLKKEGALRVVLPRDLDGLTP